MKTTIHLALVTALVLTGCYKSHEQKHQVAGSPESSPFGNSAYKLEVELQGDSSAIERFEIGVEVIGILGNFDFSETQALANSGSDAAYSPSGEVGLAVSFHQSSSLGIFNSSRVFVTCAVSGFEDNEQIASICKDKVLSEFEAKVGES